MQASVEIVSTPSTNSGSGGRPARSTMSGNTATSSQSRVSSTPKSNWRSWARKRWMWERLFSRGVATSPVILATSRAWASVLRSTEVLSVGGGDTVTVRPRRSYGYERDHRIGRLRSSLGDGRLIRLQGEAGHRRGGCDVEGVDSPAHGNHHGRIAGGDRRPA